MTTKIEIVKHQHSALPHLDVVEDPNLAPHVFMLRTANWEVVVDTKSGTLHKRKRLVFEPLPDYGSHMTWTDFCEMVAVGDIDDEDGSGTFATATTISNVDVPLDRIYNKIHHGGEDADVVVQKLKSPHDWATHVVWFNK